MAQIRKGKIDRKIDCGEYCDGGWVIFNEPTYGEAVDFMPDSTELEASGTKKSMVSLFDKMKPFIKDHNFEDDGKKLSNDELWEIIKNDCKWSAWLLAEFQKSLPLEIWRSQASKA